MNNSETRGASNEIHSSQQQKNLTNQLCSDCTVHGKLNCGRTFWKCMNQKLEGQEVTKSMHHHDKKIPRTNSAVIVQYMANWTAHGLLKMYTSANWGAGTTVSTENATLPKSSESRNPKSSVQILIEQHLNLNLYRERRRNLSFSSLWISGMLHFQWKMSRQSLQSCEDT